MIPLLSNKAVMNSNMEDKITEWCMREPEELIRELGNREKIIEILGNSLKLLEMQIQTIILTKER